MMRRKMVAPGWIVSAWVLAGLTLSGAALAAEHPPYMPTRDVAVAYRIQGTQLPAGQFGGDAQGSHSVKMIYSAASGRVRLEQTSMPGYMLIDRTGGRITMVMEPMQSFMDMPFDAKAGAGLLLNDKMAFTRAGSDRVAGVACTLWDVVHDKTTARLCITEDGVILRGEGSDPRRGKASLLATAVTYGSQPAALFSPPPGFHRMEMPALPSNLGGNLGLGGKPARPGE